MKLACAAFVAILSTISVVSAQDGGNPSEFDSRPKRPTTPPVAKATQVELSPVLDGEVRNDPAWSTATVLTGFWQTRPVEGNPASEATEVRIVYTDSTLYFGVVCYDRNPEGILATDSLRDSSLTDTDAFQIILDTYHDKQNAFLFGTNPAGIEYDGQVSQEGRGTEFTRRRQSGGSGGGFNINWDGAWEVRTRISDQGWSAEFAIPFRTLRYPKRNPQTWGVNFQRNIRRRQELAYWAPLQRQFNLYRLSAAGTLIGLDIPPQGNLKVTPYVLSEVRRPAEAGSGSTFDADSGLDVKYSLTPSLTLDATYNTDFAQVEVDEEQINLDRFSLFFPEKRPFFLENAGLFSVGTPGDVELFFSRRIGIGPNGIPIPILGGARVTGKAQKFNVGFLNMQTDQVEGITAANNFTVARVSRELPNRSSLGAIFTNRQGTGELSVGEDFNRAFAIDGQWGIGEYGAVSGFVARTTTPGIHDNQYAFKIAATRSSPGWLLRADYTELADNFNPEVGFLTRGGLGRGGYRNTEVGVFRLYRPKQFLGLHEVRPHAFYRGYWNFEGFQETGYLHMDNHLEWRNGYEIHTGVNLTREGVLEEFEIWDGIFVPPGTYDHGEFQLAANSNQADWISFRFRTVLSGFFGGERVALRPSLNLRKGEALNVEMRWERNDIDLPGGSFVSNLAGARVSYSFTPRIFVQSLLQYNNARDIWSMNFRFGWLQAANTGLYIVYNEARDLVDHLGLIVPDRSLILKYSHQFDLLR